MTTDNQQLTTDQYWMQRALKLARSVHELLDTFLSLGLARTVAAQEPMQDLM